MVKSSANTADGASAQQSAIKAAAVFLSLKFGTPEQNSLTRYDFTSPWCWEFQVDFKTSGFGKDKEKLYKIERDKKRAEIPDFDWRRRTIPGKYR